MADDVYDDLENILANSDEPIDGATELPPSEKDDPSQSIFVPEKANDDRGAIPELEGADAGDSHDEMSDGHAEDTDSDANHLADMDPAEEHDGTE